MYATNYDVTSLNKYVLLNVLSVIEKNMIYQQFNNATDSHHKLLY